MKLLKDIVYSATHKKHFWVRFFISLTAILFMGFSMSLLIRVDFGVDPCTLMNCAISDTIGISLGNWQALMNTVLLIIVLIFGVNNIGFGSLFSMFLTGYAIDFFSWIWNRYLPEELFSKLSVRIGILIPALMVFLIAVALYMDVDMGTNPFDSIPFLISVRMPKVPFRVVRIFYDFLVTVIGMIFGGKPEILTVLMVLLLGPVISGVGNFMKKHVKVFQEI